MFYCTQYFFGLRGYWKFIILFKRDLGSIPEVSFFFYSFLFLSFSIFYIPRRNTRQGRDYEIFLCIAPSKQTSFENIKNNVRNQNNLSFLMSTRMLSYLVPAIWQRLKPRTYFFLNLFCP